ncbi:MAG: hypothetical protein DMG59_08780 [Acidobacteria bacterium]|nr:MAG: hypothetical protein DMG59_08780 [Acidobacteriota bacterium]
MTFMSAVPSDKIQGVLVASITPRRSTEVTIDFGAALELIDFFHDHKVDGIALLGSTGEFPHFSMEDRARLAVMAAKRSRVPVLVNASHSTLEGSVSLARDAIDAGVAGVLLMPPYYYRYDQESIRAYCLEFAEQVKAPAYLYNIPFFTNELQIQTSLDLLASGAFAGIKDSSGKWEEFAALQKLAAEREISVFVGSDVMYSRARAAGAAGAVSGLASAVPELMVAIERRVRSGRDTKVLDAHLNDFADRVLSFPLPIAIREAVAIRGIKTGPHAIPLAPADSRRLSEFGSWFRAWLPSVTAACKSV